MAPKTWAAAASTSAVIGPGFAYLPGGNAAIGCTLRQVGSKELRRQVVEAETTLGLDVQLAVVLSTKPLGCGELFYTPVKNDVTGIGYAHTEGRELFDEEPTLLLEGLAFLNDMPYWETYPDEFRTAFLHEVGHRWGARIGASRDGEQFALTGREHGHWSYFLDSDGSPLEGNRFVEPFAYETATPELRLGYSTLDRYLMGLVKPAEVGPIRLLKDASANGTDCNGHTVTASSPPQTCAPMTLEGSWVTLGIEDVITFEGPRVPNATDAPKEISIGFFVFGQVEEAWDESACEGVMRAIEARFEDFFQATGERMRLVNPVPSELSCSELAQIVAPKIIDESELKATGGCRMEPRRTGSIASWGLAMLLLLVVAARRRRLRCYSN